MKPVSLPSRQTGLDARVRKHLLPLFTLLVGIAVTATICLWIDRYQERQIHEVFERDTARVAALAETRLRAHLETLLSIRGLFATGETIDRKRFQRFLEQLDLKKNHPGFQAIQFVRYVPENARDRFVNAVRHDSGVNPEGYPQFAIRPDVRRADHYVIEYTEPLEGNQAAFGLDLASLPSHLKALELGRDTGVPVATERVKLVQDPTGQAGFVARIPLYRVGMPLFTVEQRREALFGFGAIVYRVNDLMNEIIERQLTSHMRIQIHDTGYASASASQPPRDQGNLLFDSRDSYRDMGTGAKELPAFHASHSLDVGQRRWNLDFVAFEQSRYQRDYILVQSVAASGITISFLIALLIVALGRGRELAARLAVTLDQQKAILDNATVGIELIKDRVIQSCNQGTAELLGYEIGELLGQSTRIKYPSDEAFERAALTAYPIMLAGRSWISDVEWIRKDGTTVWCRLHGKYLDIAAPEKGSIWVSYDITAQKLADAAVAEAKARLEDSLALVQKSARELADLSELSSYLLASPGVDDALRCICAFAPRLFPHSAGAIYMMDASGETLVMRASWRDPSHAGSSFQVSECWALRRSQAYRLEQDSGMLCCPHVGADGAGSLPYVCLPLVAQATTFGLLFLEHLHSDPDTNADMRYRLAVALAEDVGLALANLQLRESLSQQSIRDPLTGLFNRRHMHDVLRRELTRAKREKTTLALIIIDVDHFKRFNDTHGHDAGDAVLQAVAVNVERQVRQRDIVCRFGGEEFVVVLPEISEALAIERAEQIRATIGAVDIKHAGKILDTVTASLGLAFYPANGERESELLKAADQALYQAKESGRNAVVVASS